MRKFDVQIALEGVAEARQKWNTAQREFQSGVDAVLDRLIHEAAVNFMSPEEFARHSGLSTNQVRALMARNGLSRSQGKTLLAKTAAEALASNAELLGIAPHEMDLMSPLAYLPMGEQLKRELQNRTVSQVHELEDELPPPIDPDGAFYAKHYADWNVHVLPLVVYVPMKDEDREAALALVRETLDEAGFDIRVSGNVSGDGRSE